MAKHKTAKKGQRVAGERWQLQTAKARFSELFRRARSEGPQWITRQDREAVVMLPAEEFERLTGRAKQPRSLAKFFCRVTSSQGGNRSRTDAGLRPGGRPVNGFLLDTNVISELVKPTPDSKVTSWIDTEDESLLCLSVLTLAEIRKGIALLPNAFRRVSLERWLDHELVLRFADRILPIDQAVADRWGRIAAQALRAKSALPVIDGLLAATAMRHNLTL